MDPSLLVDRFDGSHHRARTPVHCWPCVGDCPNTSRESFVRPSSVFWRTQAADEKSMSDPSGFELRDPPDPSMIEFTLAGRAIGLPDGGEEVANELGAARAGLHCVFEEPAAWRQVRLPTGDQA